MSARTKTNIIIIIAINKANQNRSTSKPVLHRRAGEQESERKPLVAKCQSDWLVFWLSSQIARNGFSRSLQSANTPQAPAISCLASVA